MSLRDTKSSYASNYAIYLHTLLYIQKYFQGIETHITELSLQVLMIRNGPGTHIRLPNGEWRERENAHLDYADKYEEPAETTSRRFCVESGGI